MKRFQVEVCCGSADDVMQAAKAGADRVELNSCLFLGGLTPTIGCLQVAKRHTELPALCMVRPREGGFCYTDAEFETALADAALLLEHGADGIVFGFLREDGSIDTARCAKMVELAGGRQTVFHRAIDVVPDWRAALDALIDLGVTRVLTSGQNSNVYFGAATVAAMVEYAKGRIEILPGAGITPDNVEEVLQRTECDQVHLALHKTCYDRSTAGNDSIYFGGMLYPPEDRFKMVDAEQLSGLTKLAKA